MVLCLTKEIWCPLLAYTSILEHRYYEYPQSGTWSGQEVVAVSTTTISIEYLPYNIINNDDSIIIIQYMAKILEQCSVLISLHTSFQVNQFCPYKVLNTIIEHWLQILVFQ